MDFFFLVIYPPRMFKSIPEDKREINFHISDTWQQADGRA
jgi:hypothetical protein